MKIISFDPASLRNLGWCVVVTDGGQIVSCDAGVFQAERVDKKETWKCLRPFQIFIEDLLEREQPDKVILEQTSSFQGGFVTGQCSQVLGVLGAACGKFSVNVEHVYPTKVKKALTGSGRGSKKQIQSAVTEYLSLSGIVLNAKLPEHAWDAVANVVFSLQ